MHVSKQLAISAAFSTLAMVSFVLFAVPANDTGARAEAHAPAEAGALVSALPLVSD